MVSSSLADAGDMDLRIENVVALRMRDIEGVSRDRNIGGGLWLMLTEMVGFAPRSLFTFDTWSLVTWPTIVIWT